MDKYYTKESEILYDFKHCKDLLLFKYTVTIFKHDKNLLILSLN
jgi:hypothetical protein